MTKSASPADLQSLQYTSSITDKILKIYTLYYGLGIKEKWLDFDPVFLRYNS